ncbi:MAG: efflux transporter outer membrane subunit [Betaproteobacteria bacterium]|nr:efflux transporter outer membrane subunit [Betaproteobacteria bacterium]
MRRSMPAVGALLAAALGGCNLAPDYVRPQAPVPEHWPAAARAEGTRQVADLDWQTFFPDPRLRAHIASALENNRDLRIATARVAEARALHGIQRADRLPTINLGADRVASRTPADLSQSGQSLMGQRYDVNLGLAAFELDFWGRVRNLGEAALASYLATEQARRSFRLSLISDVADAYLTLQEMGERMALARDTVQSRQEARELMARRREAGIAGDLDFLAAEGALHTARVELASLERQQAGAENLLQLLVAAPLPELPPARALTEQGIVPDLAANLPSDVLLRRPDVAAAEQQLIAANAHIGAARAAFFPRITLTGLFGTASRALHGLFSAGSETWSFQPVLSLPLFDAGRTRAGVDLAEARKVIAVAQYEKTIQQAFREVADLLVARDKLRQQLQAQEASGRAQSERVRLTGARYKAGVANYLELLDAQRDSFAAQQAVVQLRRQSLSASAQLYKALGGGRHAGGEATTSR